MHWAKSSQKGRVVQPSLRGQRFLSVSKQATGARLPSVTLRISHAVYSDGSRVRRYPPLLPRTPWIRPSFFKRETICSKYHAKGIAAFGGYFHGLSPFGKFFYLILNQSEFSVKKFLRIFDTGFSNIGATHSGCRQNEQRKSGGFKALVFCHPLWENRCRIFCMLSAG